MPDGITRVRLRILTATEEDGEGYLLECADIAFRDKLIIQLLPAEYIAIKHLFPACSSSISCAISANDLTYSLRKLMVDDIVRNMN